MTKRFCLNNSTFFRLSTKFSAPTPCPITAIYFLEFSGTLTVDVSGKISRSFVVWERINNLLYILVSYHNAFKICFYFILFIPLLLKPNGSVDKSSLTILLLVRLFLNWKYITFLFTSQVFLFVKCLTCAVGFETFSPFKALEMNSMNKLWSTVLLFKALPRENPHTLLKCFLSPSLEV